MLITTDVAITPPDPLASTHTRAVTARALAILGGGHLCTHYAMTPLYPPPSAAPSIASTVSSCELTPLAALDARVSNCSLGFASNSSFG